jgi:3',5'-cyclic AMP phosphodiesterase CpdA
VVKYSADMTRRTFVLALLLAGALRAADKPFFFIQLADPQFGFAAENKDFALETANFEKAIAAANRLRPAFVIVCGDLVNKPGDPAQVAEYLRIASQLDRSIKLYNVAGNHDIGNEPTAASIAAYKEKFGPDYYSFRVGGMAAFVLNSQIIYFGKPVEELQEQRRWLESELARAKKAGARHLVVFQHHPLFIADPAEKDAYFNIPLAARREYLDLFKKYGVSHVFTGHHHRNGLAKDGPVEVVVNGPVGKPLGPDPSGLRIVIVGDSGLEHRYYGLGDLPERVEVTTKSPGHQVP